MIADTNMKQHYGFPSGIDWSSVGVTVDESRVETELAMYAAEGDPPDPQEDTMTEADWTRMEGLIETVVQRVVVTVWREPEIAGILQANSKAAAGGLSEADVKSIVNSTRLTRADSECSLPF
jgi:hypothetical protein